MTFEALIKRVPKRAQQRMKTRHLSENKLSMLTGISQPTINRVMLGRRAITLEVADRIMKALDLTVLDLLIPAERKEVIKRQAYYDSRGLIR